MKTRHAVRKALIISTLILFSSVGYSLPFNITPKAGVPFPTTYDGIGSAVAYYTVSNTTLSERNANFVASLPQNVTQVIQNGVFNDTCGSTFNLAPAGQAGSSCTLQLSITGMVNASSINPDDHLFVCL